MSEERLRRRLRFIAYWTLLTIGFYGAIAAVAVVVAVLVAFIYPVASIGARLGLRVALLGLIPLDIGIFALAKVLREKGTPDSKIAAPGRIRFHLRTMFGFLTGAALGLFTTDVVFNTNSFAIAFAIVGPLGVPAWCFSWQPLDLSTMFMLPPLYAVYASALARRPRLATAIFILVFHALGSLATFATFLLLLLYWSGLSDA